MLGVVLVALFCLVEATGDYREKEKPARLAEKEPMQPLRRIRRLAQRLALPKAG